MSVSKIESPVEFSVASQLLNDAQLLMDEGRKIISAINSSSKDTKRKNDRTFVTQADIQIEEHFRSWILKHYPTHGVLGEEYGATNPDAEFQWILDPIDGTSEFVAGLPLYGSILAIAYKGKPFVGVIDHAALDIRIAGGAGMGVKLNGVKLPQFEARGDVLDSEIRVAISSKDLFYRDSDEGLLFDKIVSRFQNIRAYGSCYAHTYVMSGALDIALEHNLQIWDVAAAQALVEELGGKFEVYSERKSSKGKTLISAVFGKTWAVDALLETIRS
jgi:fructose-1,6-bisphosphatase/inositol monophosphatase family enzyme